MPFPLKLNILGLRFKYSNDMYSHLPGQTGAAATPFSVRQTYSVVEIILHDAMYIK